MGAPHACIDGSQVGVEDGVQVLMLARTGVGGTECVHLAKQLCIAVVVSYYDQWQQLVSIH